MASPLGKTDRASVGDLIEQFTPPQQSLLGSHSGESSFEIVQDSEESSSAGSSRGNSRSASPAPLLRTRSASPIPGSITYPPSPLLPNSQTVTEAAQSPLDKISQYNPSSTPTVSQPGERSRSSGRDSRNSAPWMMYNTGFRSVSPSDALTSNGSIPNRRSSDGSFTEERKGRSDHVSIPSGTRSPISHESSPRSRGNEVFPEDTYPQHSVNRVDSQYWIEPVPSLALAPQVRLAAADGPAVGAEPLFLRRQIPFEQRYLSVIKWLAFAAIKCFAILFFYIKMPLSSEIFLTATVASSALLWATRAELARNFDSTFNISHDYLMQSHKFLVVVNIFIGLRFLFSNLFTNSPFVCLILTALALARSYYFYKDLGEINRTLQPATGVLPAPA